MATNINVTNAGGNEANEANHGIWMGIDLGTTNSTCAVWDTTLARPKSLRLDIAAPPSNETKRHGKLVPSAVLFVERSLLVNLQKSQEDKTSTTTPAASALLNQAVEIDFNNIKTDIDMDIVALVGQPALNILEEALTRDDEKAKARLEQNDGYKGDPKNAASSTSTSFWGSLFGSNSSTTKLEAASGINTHTDAPIDMRSFTANDVNAALVSSFKRLLGKKAGDGTCTAQFLQTLPYQTNANRVSESDICIQVRPLTRSTDTNPKTPTHEDEDDNHQGEEGEGGDSPLDLDSESDSTNLVLEVLPSELTRICLQACKESAERSLSSFRNKIHPPIGKAAHEQEESAGTSSTSATHNIQNVIVGVPANYSRAQRDIVDKAARLAGFSSTVKALSESTAAIMAYGLFTSSRAHDVDDDVDNAPTKTTNSNANAHTSKIKSKMLTALVFDMGGGTTDVTIASMTRGKDSNGSDSNETGDDEAWTYRVLATEGDLTLGGDDIDELLVQWFLGKVKVEEDSAKVSSITPEQDSANPTSKDSQSNADTISNSSQQYQRGPYKACCRAKESLCGNLNKDVEPQESVLVEYGQQSFTLTVAEFEALIQTPIVEQCAKVVDDAMAAMASSSTPNSVIDEVVLVGGGSRIPAIRTMLQKKLFPSQSSSLPSTSDENVGETTDDINKDNGTNNLLCTSLNANAAVAHGTAIFGTMESGLVPRHELLSALMLDALPHAIGVLVPSTVCGDDGNDAGNADVFIEVLAKDASLPASNYETFDLSSMDQKGITIPVVELVGTSSSLQKKESKSGSAPPSPIYQKVGDFSFLLHKLSAAQKERLQKAKKTETRAVDVGISVDLDGKITVSFFDWNDPEHLQKRRQYLEKHGGKVDDDDAAEADADLNNTGESGNDSTETTLLVVACFFMLVLYITVKIMFATDPTIVRDVDGDGGIEGGDEDYDRFFSNVQDTDEF